MPISKMYIFEKLIEGYEKIPPSLKDQTLTKLAIQLCQYNDLKKTIICVPESLLDKDTVFCTAWKNMIEDLSKDIYEKFRLPPILNNSLIVRIRSIAFQMFSWNKQHQILFMSCPDFTYHLLTPADWTVEGILNEKKIAERLIEDDRIPVHQRYKLACLNFLEKSIPFLWNQISLEIRRDFCFSEESELIVWWSIKCLKIDKINEFEESLLEDTFFAAVTEGAMAAVVNLWQLLNESERKKIIIRAAMKTLDMYFENDTVHWMHQLMNCSIWLASPAHYVDILYFLLSEMSSEQRSVFFNEAEAVCKNVLKCFLHPPYQELFIPIVTQMWGIIPKTMFAEQVVNISLKYAYGENGFESKLFADYDYGLLMTELLEQTPENYMRHIFRNSYCPFPFISILENRGECILTNVIEKEPLENKNISIFQRILKLATIEEKESFMHSKKGAEVCRCVALNENWDLLNWIVKQCLPKEDTAEFIKHFTMSNYGIHTCMRLLIKDSGDSANSLFQLASLSSEEISEIKYKILSTDFQDEIVSLLKSIYSSIRVDILDRLMNRCLLKIARDQFKQQFIERNATNLCLHYIICSNWEEATYFLNWCYPSENAIVQFKRKLFHDKGLLLETDFVLRMEWLNAERLIEWFMLCPEEIKNLKRDVLLSDQFRSKIFNSMFFFKDIEKAASYLRWGSPDEETLMVYKPIFERKKGLEQLFGSMNNSPTEEEGKQLWNRLIEELQCDLHTSYDNV